MMDKRMITAYNMRAFARSEVLRETAGKTLGAELSQALMCKGRPDLYDAWGMTPLCIAAEKGDAALLGVLMVMGAEVNLASGVNQGCATPLLYAASNGQADCVRLLLAMGASPDAPDSWGNTPLFKAASYNHAECVSTLLEYKADPNQTNKYGALPLQYAALQGHHDIVDKLLKHGANPNLKGEKNVPVPLIGASMRGHHQCVSLLANAGAKVNYSENESGKTALYNSIHFYQEKSTAEDTDTDNFLKSIMILFNHGAELNSSCMDLLSKWPCMITQIQAHINLVSLILKAIPVCLNDDEQMTVLRTLFSSSAAGANNTLFDFARLLLSVGFKLHQEDLDLVSDSLSQKQRQSLEIFISQPRSLRDQCRLTIRKSMSGSVLQKVKDLPVPPPVKNYITLSSSSSYSV